MIMFKQELCFNFAGADVRQRPPPRRDLSIVRTLQLFFYISIFMYKKCKKKKK